MRSVPASLTVVLGLVCSVAAYRDSSPLLIWSRSPSQSLVEAQEAITSGIVSAEDIYRALPTLGCEWSKIALVHVEELHQSSVPSLRLGSASADLHIPYLIKPARSTLDSTIREWAAACGAEVGASYDGASASKAIIQYEAENVSDVIGEDGSLTLPDPSLDSADLIILTGTRSLSTPEKRQEPNRPDRPEVTRTSTVLSATSTASHRLPSSTHAVPTDAPLLDRVQILSTPVITALLVAFGIFIPIIMFGVSALAGIQVPPRMMEIGKGMVVGKEKKDQ